MFIIKISEDAQRKAFDKPYKFSYPQRVCLRRAASELGCPIGDSLN